MPRTPDFWASDNHSPWPPLLAPLAALYRLGQRLDRALARPADAGIPVVSIGNLVAGGAGKTPTALAFAERLGALGHAPHFLTRGYGGSERGPLRVDPAQHDAKAVGDEALLLAARAPTWLARDRPAGARAAAAAGAKLLIADDAHQTWRLARRLSVLVVDAAYRFGNGRLLPAGPLREPVAEGMARADAVVLIGAAGATLPEAAGRPVFGAAIEPDAQDAARLRNQPVLAFAGIAQPRKFFQTLEAIGARLAGTETFPDHAPYSPDTVMRLVEAAVARKATPVTTEKDWVRLPAEARQMVTPLRVRLAFADTPGLDRWLQERLPRV